MKKARYLVAGLIATVLIAVGAAAGYAATRTGDPNSGSSTGNGHMAATTSGSGSSSMMGSKGGMGSMMGGGRMGSMNGGQMQPMGSFEKNKPFDLQFIDQMTMHHEGAIMSAKNMVGDSKRPELRKLAQNIEKSQSEQVKQMQAWREQWYPGAKRTFGMMDPTKMQSMMGEGRMKSMMGGSMQQVMGADATEEMFLCMMIPHHQMAIDMSRKALKQADHPQTKDLARKIIKEQSAQIEEMRGYLKQIEKTSDSSRESGSTSTS